MNLPIFEGDVLAVGKAVVGTLLVGRELGLGVDVNVVDGLLPAVELKLVDDDDGKVVVSIVDMLDRFAAGVDDELKLVDAAGVVGKVVEEAKLLTMVDVTGGVVMLDGLLAAEEAVLVSMGSVGPVGLSVVGHDGGAAGQLTVMTGAQLQ